MSKDHTVEVPQPKDISEAERLAALILFRSTFMVIDYKAMNSQVSHLLKGSMAAAYQRGLRDAVQLLLKEAKKNEEKIS